MVPCQQLTAQRQEMETRICKRHIQTSQPGPPSKLQNQPCQALPQDTSVLKGKGCNCGVCVCTPLPSKAAMWGPRISRAALQHLLCLGIGGCGGRRFSSFSLPVSPLAWDNAEAWTVPITTGSSHCLVAHQRIYWSGVCFVSVLLSKIAS